jgi:hypothetical protein
MDKRKTWREQEQRVVESWNTAIARYRDVQAEVERERGAPGGSGASEELRLKEEAARAEVEAVRKQVARLKVEFSSGKRY